jgi:hypothetical protein
VKHIRQIAAVAITSGVAVVSLAAPPANARPAPKAAVPATRAPAAAAAGYLARHLVGRHHDHYDGSYISGGKKVVYVNYGETADAVLSMDAAGVAQAAAHRATAFLEAHVKGYAGHNAATYAPGPIGKLLLVAEAQHANVLSFGGLNLVAAVAATEGVRGAAPGEYQQNPAGTPPTFDYTSTTSQALAILGLADSPSAAGQPDAAAVTFLASQQCPDGGFPTQILATVATSCQAPRDVDSTGYAIQALLATGVHAAALPALAWLTKAEHANGGFGTPANANSTALAVQALLAGHRSVTKPLAWLRKHQVGCSGRIARRGAVAFETTYDASALLATSQAGAALAGKPLGWIDRTGARAAAPVLSCRARK